MRICNKCNINKDISCFYHSNFSWCKECFKYYYTIHRDKKIKYQIDRYHNNREKLKNYQLIYFYNHLQKHKYYEKFYRKSQNGKKIRKGIRALREKRLQLATPKWLTREHLKEIKDIYVNCPEGFHVDHIIPIKACDKITGKHVACGLHVPWNLQYLSSYENQRKRNYVS